MEKILDNEIEIVATYGIGEDEFIEGDEHLKDNIVTCGVDIASADISKELKSFGSFYVDAFDNVGVTISEEVLANEKAVNQVKKALLSSGLPEVIGNNASALLKEYFDNPTSEYEFGIVEGSFERIRKIVEEKGYRKVSDNEFGPTIDDDDTMRL